MISTQVLLLSLASSFVVLSGCSTMHHRGPVPTEPGQGAFGALSEVITILERDPTTDWSKVDIAGLRRHLVDMNRLTLDAQVNSETRADSISFTVTGEGETLRAIHSMVPAHAAHMTKTNQWQASSEKTPTGVILIVNAASAGQRQKLSALGFFGFMASGSHHQVHHMQMARGAGHAH